MYFTLTKTIFNEIFYGSRTRAVLYDLALDRLVEQEDITKEVFPPLTARSVRR